MVKMKKGVNQHAQNAFHNIQKLISSLTLSLVNKSIRRQAPVFNILRTTPGHSQPRPETSSGGGLRSCACLRRLCRLLRLLHHYVRVSASKQVRGCLIQLSIITILFIVIVMVNYAGEGEGHCMLACCGVTWPIVVCLMWFMRPFLSTSGRRG